MVGYTRRALSPVRAVSFDWPIPVLPKRVNAKPAPNQPIKRIQQQLPYELYLEIFSYLSSSDLLIVRQANTNLKLLSEHALTKRVRISFAELERQSASAGELYQQRLQAHSSSMRNYRRFMRTASADLISEATWYTSPPVELVTVCSCLCLLRGVSDDDIRNWVSVKHVMSRYDFKRWFTSIYVAADTLKIENIRRVEKVIMLDADITYERLRDVSQTGYNILIVIAAALQYGVIAHELKEKRADADILSLKAKRTNMFLNAITK